MSKRSLSITPVRRRHRRASAYFEFLEARTLFSAVNTALISFSTYFGDHGEPLDAFLAEIPASSLTRPASVAGPYGGVGFGSDFGTDFGSTTLHLTASSTGNLIGTIDTSIGGGQASTGPISLKITETSNDQIIPSNKESTGYATTDGSLFVIAVTQQDSFAENALNILLKRGAGQTDATLASDYNAVLWGTPDGANFTSGLGTMTFDGSGNADLVISSVAQGQDGGEAFDIGETDSPYTLASTGKFNLGDNDGGWVSADGSIVAWTQTVPSADPADEGSEGGLNIAIAPSTGHTAADLNGNYHLLASVEENGNFSSGAANIVFDGQGNYTETFTGVGDGTPGDSALPPLSTVINGTYTVADNGQIALDGQITGYLNADNSFAALAAVPGDTENQETGMEMLVQAPVFPPTHLVFTQQPLASTVAGQPITSAANGSLTVSVEDVHGNLVATDNANVTLTLQHSNSTLGGTTSAQLINGVATFSGLTFNNAGSYTFVATSTGLTSVKSTSFAITPDTSEPQLVILPGAHSELIGKPISPAITIKETDEFSNLIATDPSTLTATVATGPSNSITGTTSLLLTKGVATFKNLILPTAGDNYTLAFTSSNANITIPATLSLNVTLAASTVSAPVPHPSYTFGQTINLSATVKSNAPSSIPFSGTAEIVDSNNDNLGTASVSANGSIHFALTDVAGGSHTCHIVYPGDTNHSSANSKSFKLVIKKVSSSLLLQSSPAQVNPGDPILLTATVSSSSAPSVARTGTITFMDGSSILGRVTLDRNSSASLTFVPSVGVHSYSATYSGDANFLASSATENLTPFSLAGGTLLVATQRGSTPSIEPPALSLVTFSDSSNAATVTGLIGTGGDSTYAFTRTSTTTAALKITFTSGGSGSATLHLSFSVPITGTYSDTFSSGSKGSGAFVLYANPLPSQAPDGLAGGIVTLTATAGQGVFGASGTSLLTVASDNSYTLISTAGGNINTAGSSTYSLINPTIAEFDFADNAFGSGQLFLTFTSNAGGMYYIVNSNQDWQTGSFTLQ